MRESGIPKALTWRWAPCAALALGALSFAAFAMLVIPDHIGDLGAAAPARIGLPGGNGFGAVTTGNNGFPAQPVPAPPANWSDAGRGFGAPATQLAARAGDAFPRRGFSPPLERPEAPAPPPQPVPAVMPSPQPAAEAPLAPPQAPAPQVAPPPTPPPPADPPAAMASPETPPPDAPPARF